MRRISFLAVLLACWCGSAWAQITLPQPVIGLGNGSVGSSISLCYNASSVSSSNPYGIVVCSYGGSGGGGGGGAVTVTPNAVTTGDVTSFTAGGTAQTLFGGTTPTNGWAIYNPKASDDCWVSDSTTAAVNGAGSIRVAANGGGYETPMLYKPPGAVSLICPTTGDKMTARRW